MKKVNIYFSKLKELSKGRKKLTINKMPDFFGRYEYGYFKDGFIDTHTINGSNIIPFGSEAYSFFISEYRENKLCKDNHNNIILGNEYKKILKK